MCEQTPVEYKDGDIVWVKISSCWWPGEVTGLDKLPEDVAGALTKPHIAAVKFFDEDSYEYVKNLNKIYFYNCNKKNDFIKKGLDLVRAKNSYMDKFPADICTAETRTGGDPNILNSSIFREEKKTNYAAQIFGTPSHKKSPKESNKKGRRNKPNQSPLTGPSRSSAGSSRLITHPRFIGRDDHEIRILIQKPVEAVVQEVREQVYNCQTCSFRTPRIDVIILHNKSHIQGVYSTPISPIKKVKKSPIKKNTVVWKMTVSNTNTIDEDLALIEQGIPLSTDSADEEQVLEEPKVKRKRKGHSTTPKRIAAGKRKQKKSESKNGKDTKLDICNDLLAEWEEDSDAENSGNVTASSEVADLSSTSKTEEESESKDEESTSKLVQIEAKKSCFDFDDDEDSPIMGTSVGRKIPRVIPQTERQKPNITDDLESLDELPLNEPVAEVLQELPTDESKKTDKQPADITPVPAEDTESEDINKTFESILEATALPKLPEVPQLLKCEQNFHSAGKIKFPDKPDAPDELQKEDLSPEVNIDPMDKPAASDIATKFTIPKKRFAKNFEEFVQSLNEPKIQDDGVQEEAVEVAKLKTQLMSKLGDNVEKIHTRKTVYQPRRSAHSSVTESDDEKPPIPVESYSQTASNRATSAIMEESSLPTRKRKYEIATTVSEQTTTLLLQARPTRRNEIKLHEHGIFSKVTKEKEPVKTYPVQSQLSKKKEMEEKQTEWEKEVSNEPVPAIYKPNKRFTTKGKRPDQMTFQKVPNEKTTTFMLRDMKRSKHAKQPVPDEKQEKDPVSEGSHHPQESPKKKSDTPERDLRSKSSQHPKMSTPERQWYSKALRQPQEQTSDEEDQEDNISLQELKDSAREEIHSKIEQTTTAENPPEVLEEPSKEIITDNAAKLSPESSYILNESIQEEAPQESLLANIPSGNVNNYDEADLIPEPINQQCEFFTRFMPTNEVAMAVSPTELISEHVQEEESMMMEVRPEYQLLSESFKEQENLATQEFETTSAPLVVYEQENLSRTSEENQAQHITLETPALQAPMVGQLSQAPLVEDLPHTPVQEELPQKSELDSAKFQNLVEHDIQEHELAYESNFATIKNPTTAVENLHIKHSEEIYEEVRDILKESAASDDCDSKLPIESFLKESDQECHVVTAEWNKQEEMVPAKDLEPNTHVQEHQSFKDQTVEDNTQEKDVDVKQQQECGAIEKVVIKEQEHESETLKDQPTKENVQETELFGEKSNSSKHSKYELETLTGPIAEKLQKKNTYSKKWPHQNELEDECDVVKDALKESSQKHDLFSKDSLHAKEFDRKEHEEECGSTWQDPNAQGDIRETDLFFKKSEQTKKLVTNELEEEDKETDWNKQGRKYLSKKWKHSKELQQESETLKDLTTEENIQEFCGLPKKLKLPRTFGKKEHELEQEIETSKQLSTEGNIQEIGALSKKLKHPKAFGMKDLEQEHQKEQERDTLKYLTTEENIQEFGLLSKKLKHPRTFGRKVNELDQESETSKELTTEGNISEIGQLSKKLKHSKAFGIKEHEQAHEPEQEIETLKDLTREGNKQEVSVLSKKLKHSFGIEEFEQECETLKDPNTERDLIYKKSKHRKEHVKEPKQAFDVVNNPIAEQNNTDDGKLKSEKEHYSHRFETLTKDWDTDQRDLFPKKLRHHREHEETLKDPAKDRNTESKDEFLKKVKHRRERARKDHEEILKDPTEERGLFSKISKHAKEVTQEFELVTETLNEPSKTEAPPKSVEDQLGSSVSQDDDFFEGLKMELSKQSSHVYQPPKKSRRRSSVKMVEAELKIAKEGVFPDSFASNLEDYGHTSIIAANSGCSTTTSAWELKSKQDEDVFHKLMGETETYQHKTHKTPDLENRKDKSKFRRRSRHLHEIDEEPYSPKLGLNFEDGKHKLVEHETFGNTEELKICDTEVFLHNFEAENKAKLRDACHEVFGSDIELEKDEPQSTESVGIKKEKSKRKHASHEKLRPAPTEPIQLETEELSKIVPELSFPLHPTNQVIHESILSVVENNINQGMVEIEMEQRMNAENIVSSLIVANDDKEEMSALSTLAAVSELTTNLDMQANTPQEGGVHVAENELANGQVEQKPLKPLTLTNFSVDFCEPSNSGAMPIDLKIGKKIVKGTKVTVPLKSLTKLERIGKDRYIKCQKNKDLTFAINLLQDGKKEIVNIKDIPQKLPVPSSTSGDLEDQIPPTILRCNERSIESEVAKLTDTKPGSECVLRPLPKETSSSKLLKILTDVKANTEKPSPPIEPHKPEFHLIMANKNSETIIIGKPVMFPTKSNKPIILSEKIIKPIVELSEQVSVQKVTSKRSYQDIEDIDTFIIQKPRKKVLSSEVETISSKLMSYQPVKKPREEICIPTVVKKIQESMQVPVPAEVLKKIRGKARILQQTIITPAGDVIQPNVSQPLNVTQPPKITQPHKVSQPSNVSQQPSGDDSIMFDINSMPIVMGDQILTPESIENMPIVLEEPAPTPKPPVTLINKLTPPSQVKLLNKSPATTTRTYIKAYTPHKPGKPQKVYQAPTKILKNSPSVITQQGKPGKYLIVPAGTSPAASTTSRYTVGKRPPIIKRSTPITSAPSTITKLGSETIGNKIMIVTNQQGQQSRVVLTPAQQKLLGYQSPSSKLVKNIPKTAIISKASNVLPSKTPNIISHAILTTKGQNLITSDGQILMSLAQSDLKNYKFEHTKPGKKLQTQRVLLQDKVKPPQQKTIVIKNQQGQIMRKIQGTDDALLEQQVAEQVQAIKASGSFSSVKTSTKPDLNLYKTKRSPAKKTASELQQRVVAKPQLVLNSTMSAPKLPNKAEVSSIPPLAPISPVKKVEVTAPPTPKVEDLTSTSKEATETKPLQQLIIQDALGNQTTITEGQILALPSETVDGQPQSYVLITLDESGNLTPLNNEALLSLDPNLCLGGDLSNTVLHIDESALMHDTTSSQKALVTQVSPSSAALPPELPQPSLSVQVTSEEQKDERLKACEEAPSKELAQENVQTVTCSIGNDPNQQLIITGDPISTQKLIDSLAEGNADLANLLAGAEGNILIHTDGQQILINTDSESQLLLPMSSDSLTVAESTEGGGNPIFATQPMKNQDILAAALADTDVFQQEQSTSHAQIKISHSQLSPSNSIYPMNVSNVYGTTLSLSSPIMTPLEVPSTNSKKIPDDATDILTTEVAKNVDLPITITDPNISQTVAHQQVINELQHNLELPIAISDQIVPSTANDLSSSSFVYALPSLEESVDMHQKAFTAPISMPLLNEDPEETMLTETVVSETTVAETETLQASVEPVVFEEPVVMTSKISVISNVPTPCVSVPLFETPASLHKDIDKYIILPNRNYMQDMEEDDGLCTLGGAICSSLSEPPPDMFDVTVTQSYDSCESKELEISNSIEPNVEISREVREDTEEVPKSLEDIPYESSKTAEESIQGPKESIHTPEESIQTPEEFIQTPEEAIQGPKESIHTPEESIQTPEESIQTPVESIETIEASIQSSKESIQMPEEPIQAPEESIQTPAESIQTPEEFIQLPEKTIITLEESNKLPEELSETPEEFSKTREELCQTLEDQSKTIEEQTATPQELSQTSEDSSKTSGELCQIPEESNKTPEASFESHSCEVTTADPKSPLIEPVMMQSEVDGAPQDGFSQQDGESSTNSERFDKFEAYEDEYRNNDPSLCHTTSESNSPLINIDENSCEIRVQPPIVTDLSAAAFEINKLNEKRSYSDDEAIDNENKKAKFD